MMDAETKGAVRKLTMSHLKALMPETEAADAAFHAALATVQTNEQLAAIVATYNAVLERCAEAIYLDTADRNSRSTIMMVYRPAKPYETWFAHAPLATLQRLAGQAEE